MNTISFPVYQKPLNLLNLQNANKSKPSKQSNGDSLHFSGSSRRFHAACSSGDILTIRHMLNERHDPNERILFSSDRDVALHHAIRGKQEAVLDLLLQVVYHASPRGNNDMTPLMLASELGQHNTVKKLIAKKVTTSEERESDNATAFMIAAQKNHLNILQELLNYKPKLLHTQGLRALQFALMHNSKEAANYLLNKGVNPYTKVGEDENPLISDFAKYNWPKAVEFLLERGVDPNRTNKWGDKAVDVAASDEIKMLLQKYDRLKSISTSNQFRLSTNIGDNLLLNALKNGNRDSAKRLILQGKGLNTQDEEGNTPLHLAVNRRDEEIVMLLVAKNADTSLVNNKAKDAAQLALKKGYMNIFEIITGK